MIYKVFAIRDTKSCFMSPVVDINEQSAIRNFDRAVHAGDQSLIAYAPGDFDLYCIGEYNDQSGELVPKNPVIFICNGASLIGGKSDA